MHCCPHTHSHLDDVISYMKHEYRCIPGRGSYLQCVTGEVRLFVPPHALSGHDEHHDPENKQHREPDFAQAGGVAVCPD